MRGNRRMPLLAAAATLSFGTACGDDDSATSESLAALGEMFSETYCGWQSECESSFSNRYESVAACEEERAYTASYFDTLTEAADDPQACRDALADVLRCSIDLFVEDESCDALDYETEDDPCGPVDDAAAEVCPSF